MLFSHFIQTFKNLDEVPQICKEKQISLSSDTNLSVLSSLHPKFFSSFSSLQKNIAFQILSKNKQIFKHGNGWVRQTQHQNTQIWLKYYSQSKNFPEIENLLKIVSFAHSQFLPQIYECEQIGNEFFVVLNNFYQPLSDYQQRVIFHKKSFVDRLSLYQQLSKALDQIHNKDIVLMNIQPKYIYSKDKEISQLFFTNFDNADFQETNCKKIGPKFYLSPLQIKDQVLHKRSKGDDIWKLGLTLFQLELDEFDLHYEIDKDLYQFKLSQQILDTLYTNMNKMIGKKYSSSSLGFFDFFALSQFFQIIRDCLSLEEAQRPTSAQLFEQFQEVINNICKNPNKIQQEFTLQDFLQSSHFPESINKNSDIVQEDQLSLPLKICQQIDQNFSKAKIEMQNQEGKNQQITFLRQSVKKKTRSAKEMTQSEEKQKREIVGGQNRRKSYSDFKILDINKQKNQLENKVDQRAVKLLERKQHAGKKDNQAQTDSNSTYLKNEDKSVQSEKIDNQEKSMQTKQVILEDAQIDTEDKIYILERKQHGGKKDNQAQTDSNRNYLKNEDKSVQSEKIDDQEKSMQTKQVILEDAQINTEDKIYKNQEIQTQKKDYQNFQQDDKKYLFPKYYGNQFKNPIIFFPKNLFYNHFQNIDFPEFKISSPFHKLKIENKEYIEKNNVISENYKEQKERKIINQETNANVEKKPMRKKKH